MMRNIIEGVNMLRAAISFFVIGFIAFLLGVNQVGGLSIELGQILLGAFLFIAVILFIGALIMGNQVKQEF